SPGYAPDTIPLFSACRLGARPSQFSQGAIHEQDRHYQRQGPSRHRHLLPGDQGRQHRLHVRPDPAGSGEHGAGRRLRSTDRTSVREPQGRCRSRRWFVQGHRQAEHLPHRPLALRQGQRNHGPLLRAALPGTRRYRRGCPAARCAGGNGRHPGHRVSRSSGAPGPALPSPPGMEIAMRLLSLLLSAALLGGCASTPNNDPSGIWINQAAIDAARESGRLREALLAYGPNLEWHIDPQRQQASYSNGFELAEGTLQAAGEGRWQVTFYGDYKEQLSVQNGELVQIASGYWPEQHFTRTSGEPKPLGSSFEQA